MRIPLNLETINMTVTSIDRLSLEVNSTATTINSTGTAGDNSQSTSHDISYYIRLRQRFGIEISGVLPHFYASDDQLNDDGTERVSRDDFLPYNPFLGAKIAFTLVFVIFLLMCLMMYYKFRLRCNNWCEEWLDNWESHQYIQAVQRKERRHTLATAALEQQLMAVTKQPAETDQRDEVRLQIETREEEEKEAPIKKKCAETKVETEAVTTATNTSIAKVTDPFVKVKCPEAVAEDLETTTEETSEEDHHQISAAISTSTVVHLTTAAHPADGDKSPVVS